MYWHMRCPSSLYVLCMPAVPFCVAFSDGHCYNSLYAQNEKEMIDMTETERETKKENKDRPRSGRGTSWIRQQFGRGLTYFIVVAAGIMFYFALLRATNLTDVLWTVVDVLKPILYGLIIAYLLNPIVKQVDRHLGPALKNKMKNETKAKKLSRAAGIALAVVFLFFLITALINMLIPELYKSIRDLVMTLPGQLNSLGREFNRFYANDSAIGDIVKRALSEGTDMLQNWLRTDLLARINDLMASLTEGVISFLSEVFNALIGVIVSVYVLFSKEKFVSQTKKTVYAVFSTRNANAILHLTRKSNEIFGGFIIGKIIDSAIIGVLCFIGISILRMPYVMLVSVIVGVTNVIPFFGPYIGAIPSAVLIMLADPLKGVYFVIFIFLLQQLDGNFIGPKILGNSTGLSAFWVIFSILLGGGLFGFPGMLMGVPTFAVIYYIVQTIVNRRLENKNLPTQSDFYDELSYVDDSGSYVGGGDAGDTRDGQGSEPENGRQDQK